MNTTGYNNSRKASETKFANSPARMQRRLDEKFGGHIRIHSGYTGFRFPAVFHCSKHNEVFQVPRAEAMIHDRVGCPTCARENSKAIRQAKGTGYTTASYRQAVREKFGRKITVVGEYGGYESRCAGAVKTLHRCSKHGEFEAWPEYILYRGLGCPDCGREAKQNRANTLTGPEFRRELKAAAPRIRHIGEYGGKTVRTEFRCRDCAHEWKTTPDSVLAGHGCPACGLEATFAKRHHGSRLRPYKLGRREVMVQGFEPQALDYLRSVGYRPEQIFVGSDVPKVRYSYRGKNRTYYPDIWIPHLNLIVEVKSVYWLGITDIEIFRQVCAKREATMQYHNFAVLVMHEDGSRMMLPKDWATMTHTQLRKAVCK